MIDGSRDPPRKPDGGQRRHQGYFAYIRGTTTHKYSRRKTDFGNLGWKVNLHPFNFLLQGFGENLACGLSPHKPCAMPGTHESYRRIGDPEDRFDFKFCQSQGEQAVFAAALEMISDYLFLRYGHADQPRLQRTVESFGKI
jgi:hypothetical protein